MSKSSLRSGLFALRTLVPAALAVALMGAMPAWVQLAHAQSYYTQEEEEIFGAGGICQTADPLSELATQCILITDAGDEAEAAAQISGQAAFDAMAAPILATYNNVGEIGGQLSGVLADRRGGASGLSIAGVKILGKQLNDGKIHLFEDSAAGADLDGRLGVFLNGLGGFGSVSASAQSDGLKFTNGGLIAGMDYRVRDNVIAGAAFNWIRTDTDYKNNLGSSLSDSYGGTLYATWWGESAYLDGMLNYSYADYDMKRNFTFPTPSTAKGDTSSNQLFFSMRGGFTLPEEDWMGGFRFGPQARLDVVKMWMKGYTETGSAFASTMDKFDVTSVTTNLGGEISYEIEMESSTFTPRFYALWVHEFENDAQTLVTRLVLNPTTPITTITASPDRDFGRLGVELNWGLSGGISMFLDYEAIVGLKNVESNQFGIGGRVEF